LLVLVAVVLLLLPLVMLMKEPLGDLGRMWDKAGDQSGLGAVLRNTFLLAIGSVTLTVIMGTALAWCTVQLPPGRYTTVANLIAVTPLTVPSVAAVVGWIFLFSPKIGYGNALLRWVLPIGGKQGPIDVYSLPAIVGITSVALVPFVYLFVLSALRNVDVGMEDAARASGAGWWRVQWSIVLRSIRPAVLYGTVVVLLLGLGQFTAPLFLGEGRIEVITTRMFFQTTAVPPDYAFAAILAVPLVITALLLVYLQRRLVGSVDRYQVVTKGASRLRRRRRWPLIPVVLFGVFTVLPPLAGLGIVALSPYWSKDIDWGALSTSNFGNALSDPFVRSAFGNSLKFALVSVVILMAVSLPISLYLYRADGVLKRVLDYVVSLPLSVPGIVFGMGIFIAYALGPVKLYGSAVLFVIAYVIITLPHAVRILSGGIAQIGRSPQDAARVAGAGRTRTLRSVLLPLLRGPLGGAAILGFIIMVQEFGAAALIRSTNTNVLSTTLYERWEFGGYSAVATLALLMVLLCLLGVGLILLVGGRSALER
jgi:iron(III) transport system permease protein